MPQLFIAIPTKLQIHANTMLSIFECENFPDYTIRIKYLVGKSNVDQARSMMVTEWYDMCNDDDLFLFIDSDQIFKKEDIQALIDLNCDVACGIYRGFQWPCVRVENWNDFITGRNNHIMYGATGLMLIRKPILKKLEEFIKEEQMGTSRVYVSPDYPSVIPFFKQRVIVSESMKENGPIREWLGEDYSFCYLVRKIGGVIKAHISPTIGHEITEIKYFYPQEYKKRIWENKTITYYTGNSRIYWSANDIETKGLWGSETAVINLAQQWQKMGYKVTVYGNCEEGEFDGVKYLQHSKCNFNDIFNIMILWRSYGLQCLSYVKARQIIVDLHDELSQNYDAILQFWSKVDKIMVKSQYHKSLFSSDLHDKLEIVQNGVPEYYRNIEEKKKDHEEKKKYKLIYSSSYVRGLLYMLKWGWPLIKRSVPEAELHLYYGMDLIPKDIMQELQTLLQQDGIFQHGKINQIELSKEKMEGSIYYYVGGYQEIDCINIKEAVLANCLPVLCNFKVFKERDHLIRIGDDPADRQTQITGAQEIIKLLQDEEYYQEKLEEMSKYKEEIEFWDTIADKWTKKFIN